MRANTLVLACLALSGHGRRLYFKSDKLEVSEPLKSLSAIFVAFNPNPSLGRILTPRREQVHDSSAAACIERLLRMHGGRTATLGTRLLKRRHHQKHSGRNRVGVVWSLHSKTEFDMLVAATPDKTLIVVDFYAEWCGPCQQIAGKLDAMAARYDHVKFVKIDIDECPELRAMYGVSAMPTFKLLKGGKEVGSMQGPDVNGLHEKIQALDGKLGRLAKPGECGIL
jgi:thioredoxin